MNIKNILTRFRPIIQYIKRYRVILFALFFLGMYTYLIFQINTLAQQEPDPSVVSENINTIKRLQVDQNSINSILELEEQNIEVQALFQEARANPFTE
jgi:hypothetical protein